MSVIDEKEKSRQPDYAERGVERDFIVQLYTKLYLMVQNSCGIDARVMIEVPQVSPRFESIVAKKIVVECAGIDYCFYAEAHPPYIMVQLEGEGNVYEIWPMPKELKGIARVNPDTGCAMLDFKALVAENARRLELRTQFVPLFADFILEGIAKTLAKTSDRKHPYDRKITVSGGPGTVFGTSFKACDIELQYSWIGSSLQRQLADVINPRVNHGDVSLFESHGNLVAEITWQANKVVNNSVVDFADYFCD